MIIEYDNINKMKQLLIREDKAVDGKKRQFFIEEEQV